MFVSCNDYCVDFIFIILDCFDIILSMVCMGNQIEVIVLVCYFYNFIVIWMINGKEIEFYSGLFSIFYLGNGIYGVFIFFLDNCFWLVSEYYCDSFMVDIVNEVSYLRVNLIGCFILYYQWFKLGEINLVVFNMEIFMFMEVGSY